MVLCGGTCCYRFTQVFAECQMVCCEPRLFSQPTQEVKRSYRNENGTKFISHLFFCLFHIRLILSEEQYFYLLYSYLIVIRSYWTSVITSE